MADVPNGPKISVDSNETVLDLHKKLKDTINRKLKEKDWTEEKKEEFKGRILKVWCLLLQKISCNVILLTRSQNVIMCTTLSTKQRSYGLASGSDHFCRVASSWAVLFQNNKAIWTKRRLCVQCLLF